LASSQTIMPAHMINVDPPFHPIIGFVAIFIAWFLAQATKVLTDYIQTKKLHVKSFMDTGGMPSSHSATVAALATAVYLYYGYFSMPFLITLIFTLITMFDAAVVRRSIGRQAQALNRIIEDLAKHEAITEERVKELLGHTPVQVFAGAFLGIAVALIICG
jgi:acid phosphatase family membrane protein YuiD